MKPIIKDNESRIIKQDFAELIKNLYQTHLSLQRRAANVINTFLTVRNWLFGYYIVEYEQNGADRAKYGTKLLEEIAEQVKEKGIKGIDPQSLRNCRIFYQLYPQIQQTIPVKSLQVYNEQIRGTLTRESQASKIQQDIIRGTLSRELKIVEPKFDDFVKNNQLNPDLLLSRLSFSHFIALIRVKDNLERFFYEVEAVKNNWSVRELERAINTSLALRTTLSIDKEAIIAKIKNLKPLNTSAIIRSPIVLNFLELREEMEYSETELEQQILNNLQLFLLELGTGFCFEARQKRITFNNKHYRIDLVFYHKILKCNVLIDLKTGEFDHADAGQMNLYLNYYKENEMAEGDNPPVGIILCAAKDETLVRYATAGMDDMFVSTYMLKLPNKKVLENFLLNEINK